MTDNMKICQECFYWSPIANHGGVKHTGICHFWPPSQSKVISQEIRVEQVVNPRIKEVENSLSEAEKLQKKLITIEKELFEKYPVKTSLDELQDARQRVQEGD